MNNGLVNALAVLLRKFGTKIPGGGYEVQVTHEELAALSPFGQIKEEQNPDLKILKWQYFPNHTIEGQGGIVQDPALPEQTNDPSTN